MLKLHCLLFCWYLKMYIAILYNMSRSRLQLNVKTLMLPKHWCFNAKNVDFAYIVVLMISNEQHCIWCFAMRCLMIESKIALLKCWHCYNFFLCQLSTSTLISLHFLNCKYPNFGFWNILFLPWKSLTFNLNRAVLRALIYCWYS